MDDSINQFRYRSGAQSDKASIKEKEKEGSEEGVQSFDEGDDHDVYGSLFFFGCQRS